jgi:hypothetical protein
VVGIRVEEVLDGKPLLADIQQKTFEGNRGGRPMDLITHTATRGLHLRRHRKFGGRMLSTRQAGGRSDPAHAWSTYRMCGQSSFPSWPNDPLIARTGLRWLGGAAERAGGLHEGMELKS